MTQLRTIDAAALAHLSRALIGFDRIWSDAESRTHNNYPPFNLIKHSEINFEIQLAVAGFNKAEITVEVDQDQLIIRGQKAYAEAEPEYLHRGLAARDFEKSWTLADHMEVDEVELTNGILSVKITRIVPEALKPRLIAIKG
jgi:molecular chaperone IbpA